MRRFSSYLIICLGLIADNAPAGNGPAGATGACSHVIGPVDTNGNPIGFTCSDVGGSALLVWNASQLGGNITVSGGINTLNLFTKSFLVNGSFTSDGPLAMIGNRTIIVSGSISGSSVVVASLTASENDLTTSLLNSTPGRITSTSTFPVEIAASGKVQASSGNLIVAGNTVTNRGKLIAEHGYAILKSGTKLDVGWSDVNWEEGVHSDSAPQTVTNNGEVKAANVIIEAHRANTTSTTIFNNGKITATGTAPSGGTVTFVTALPGSIDGLGNYSPGSFGISNTTGRVFASQVTISPFYQPPPGGAPTSETFILSTAADKAQLQTNLGGKFFDPTQDNTPASAAAPVIGTGNTFTVTSNIVVPQLAPSMSHLNAASNVAKPVLVVAKAGTEQVRGESTQAAAPKTKPRGKAKPVLVRGAFFDSKISAVITANP